MKSATDQYRLRIAMAAINPTVGDLDGNSAEVVRAVAAAAQEGAHLIVFPEMVLTGYPVEDLALRSSFRQASKKAIDALAIELAEQGHGDLVAIVGENDEHTYNHITFGDYADLVIPSQQFDNPLTDKVAIVVARGVIVDGVAKAGSIGGDSTAALLRQARHDDKVKAVVLRIDSPGGSAYASEIIGQEIRLLREAGKPVIASMGSVAASGGYWIAAPANEIWAAPTTITGSIGIFAQFFNFENFFKNKLGITHDRVNTNAHSDFPTVTRELTDFEKNWFQARVNAGYETFTSKAAQGRHMNIDKLKSLAGGRVWTGEQAKANGLVDVLGDLNKAIEIAAKMAKVKTDDYKVRYYPTPKSFFEELMDKKEDEMEAKFLKAQFGEMASYVKQVQKVKTQEGYLALMPFAIEFK